MSILAPPPVQRTGPALVRDCHMCQGVGYPGCRTCKGTGKTVRDLAPFVALGSLCEHVGALQNVLGLSFETIYGDGCGGNLPKLKIGTPAYHVRALAEYANALFQQLVVMLPEEFSRTEGT